jgi:hypothetical protein
MPTGRIWARGGECEERASKALFKPISRINLFISNMMYEVHSCSPRFTKVTILPAPLKWLPPASPCIRSFFLQFATVLFFCLIQSYWVSKVRYCLPLVCSCTHNKTIHVTANLLHQQIFLLLRTACYIFTTFWWLFLVSIGQKLCEYWLATHTLSPTHTHTLNPHVYILTYVCIIMYMYLFCLICIYMYTHVYMFIPAVSRSEGS